MRFGIIGGTGVYRVKGIETREEKIQTRYGSALVFLGCGDAEDLVFLTRHGPDHSIPPHKINYRANIAALKLLGVEWTLATYCVGSLHESIAPTDVMLVDQYIDLASGREHTFFEGGQAGLGHTDVTQPYCETLRQAVLRSAEKRKFPLISHGTYVCTNGPRFETAAEVRMAAQLGGDVVGMTGGTETALAREAGLHYAAAAYSINYGAGLISAAMEFKREEIGELLDALLEVFIEALRNPFPRDCSCDKAVIYKQEPALDLYR
jgi:5'-methylthioadenosine phosphorylase